MNDFELKVIEPSKRDYKIVYIYFLKYNFFILTIIFKNVFIFGYVRSSLLSAGFL